MEQKKGLFNFQQAVFDTLKNGQNVILQAPTGAGKTQAALAPFLYFLAENRPENFPRKCIYSVPMRVLANQFIAKYQEDVASYQRKRRIQPEPQVSIQTGENPDDPHFEDTLIFATIDQTLSSFLNIPYGVSGRFANLNAGAVMGSYLVFDEFHLFGPGTSLPTTLAMLKMLNGITPFILMTATFSQTMLNELAQELDAVVIPPKDAGADYFQDVPAQQAQRTRVFGWIPEPLTAERVLMELGHKTICICNTVDRARDLADTLRKKSELTNYQITLIHSQFFPHDRKEIEEQIRTDFRNADGKEQPQLLVATQVIEVGLDISCDVLHTELAPANSLLQRAGRCARREGEHGRVYVYEPPDASPYYFPPKDPESSRESKIEMERNKILLDNIRAALASGEFTAKHMDFALEQKLIDAVHTEVDWQILAEIKAQHRGRVDDMLFTIVTNDRGKAPELIRESDTRYVVIHSNPDKDDKIKGYPWVYEGLSLRMNSVYAAWKSAEDAGLLDDNHDLPWVAMQAVPLQTDAADVENEGQQQPRYEWKPIKEPGQLYGSLAVALHPNFAAYSPLSGLQLGRVGEHIAPELRPRRQPYRGGGGGYECETYAQHITGLYNAYRKAHWLKVPHWNHDARKYDQKKIERPALRDEIAYTIQQLEKRYNLPSGRLDEVIRLMLALHDLGKLSVDWQRFAHEWQKAVKKDVSDSDMLAHTDYNSGNEDQKALMREFQNKYQRGNHAGESAMAITHFIMNIVGGQPAEALLRGAITAVARHHTTQVSDYTAFTYAPAAQPTLCEALAVVGLSELEEQLMKDVLWKLTSKNTLTKWLSRIDGQHMNETLLYLFLVRVLRLADQRSFEAGIQ